jgi:SAM-dependent methyltransferase
MFAEEARWLRGALDGLPIGEGTTVLDIGSQTLEFRTTVQPYIDAEIFAPIRARGAHVTHLDAQRAKGVDIVADITAEDFALGDDRRFDLVICTNLLEHVRDRPRTIQRLDAVTAGHLVVTVPGHFPYHEDPIDTMYRPTPRRLAADVVAVAGDLTPVRSTSIHILDRSWYLSALSRCRRFVPPMRWRTSAAVFERRIPAA